MTLLPTPGEQLFLTRRDLLRRCGMGFAALGLAGLLPETAGAAVTDVAPLAPRAPHFPARAKRVIHIFANGGASHVDTFDPKPALTANAGKALPMNLRTERRTGAAFPSPFKFQMHGKSGIEVSELFPHVARAVDEFFVVRSRFAAVP